MQRVNSLEKTLMLGKIEGWRRRGWQRITWLDSIIDSMDMSLSKPQEIVKDRGDWYAGVHGVAKSHIWLSDWTTNSIIGLSSWLSGKESTCQCTKYGFKPWVGKNPWRRKWQLSPVFLPGKSHGQRSLVGYIVHGVAKELDMTQRLNNSNILLSRTALKKYLSIWLCESSSWCTGPLLCHLGSLLQRTDSLGVLHTLLVGAQA